MVSDEAQPSYEELASWVMELRSALDTALTQLADLEGRLQQNSTNSHHWRPPDQSSASYAPTFTISSCTTLVPIFPSAVSPAWCPMSSCANGAA